MYCTGIRGLLEEGRQVKLSERGGVNDSHFQHLFVKNVLTTLLTPYMPPFYRIFLSGMLPSKARNDPKWLVATVEHIKHLLPDNSLWRQQYADNTMKFMPWFYGPFLTSLVSPFMMHFLVGPSRPNRRRDGKRGGMLVEKCKYLQVRGPFTHSTLLLIKCVSYRNQTARGCVCTSASCRRSSSSQRPWVCR